VAHFSRLLLSYEGRVLSIHFPPQAGSTREPIALAVWDYFWAFILPAVKTAGYSRSSEYVLHNAMDK